MPLNSRKELYKQALYRAQSLLAMREHGAKELLRKLQQKLPEAAEVGGLLEEVLEECQRNNWQSDARYIESYTRMAREKGQGALKIRQTLRRATDAEDLINQELEQNSDDWKDLAREVLLKKYGETAKPKETKEYARRLRFLQGRGFNMEQCYRAFT